MRTRDEGAHCGVRGYCLLTRIHLINLWILVFKIANIQKNGFSREVQDVAARALSRSTKFFDKELEFVNFSNSLFYARFYRQAAVEGAS